MSTNTPISIWRTTDGNTDNVYTGLTFIVDTDDNNLVDPSGDYIIDTGVEMTIIPSSVWEENDGV